MVAAIVVFGVLTSVVYYVFARAEITRFLWSRYPRALDRMARCSACTGWWLGATLSFYIEPPSIGYGRWWERPLWGAIWGLALTPLGTWLITHALAQTHIPEEGEDDGPR